MSVPMRAALSRPKARHGCWLRAAASKTSAPRTLPENEAIGRAGR